MKFLTNAFQKVCSKKTFSAPENPDRGGTATGYNFFGITCVSTHFWSAEQRQLDNGGFYSTTRHVDRTQFGFGANADKTAARKLEEWCKAGR